MAASALLEVREVWRRPEEGATSPARKARARTRPAMPVAAEWRLPRPAPAAPQTVRKHLVVPVASALLETRAA